MSMNKQNTMEERFNGFIKKWCGENASHLLDSDENDGERFRQELKAQEEGEYERGLRDGAATESSKCVHHVKKQLKSQAQRIIERLEEVDIYGESELSQVEKIIREEAGL